MALELVAAATRLVANLCGGPLSSCHEDAMTLKIGILTYAGDPHGHVVKRTVEEQHGAWCCLIPSDELAIRGKQTWSSQRGGPSLLPTLDGGVVDVQQLDAMWYRRTSTKQPLPVNADQNYQDHVTASISKMLMGVLLNEFHGNWISHPIATQISENKLVQLRAAQQAGIRIPATLISQDPELIRDFCAAHPGAIVKSVTATRGTPFAVTSRVTPALLERDEILSLSPSIYQECVPGVRHLRISLFGDRCDGALIEAEELDWRLDLTVPFRPYLLDSELEQRLRAVLRELGLVMGIFDVKLTDEGSPVFLEVNAQGQFLFVEALCGIPLADAFAEFLVKRAARNTGRLQM
jgi:glutathione synthase/RimK-type ligase-like ATP-grasp enzyme